MDKKFVMVKLIGEKTSVIVNLDQVTMVRLSTRELFLSDGSHLEVERDDFVELNEVLKARSMYPDGSPCADQLKK